MEHKKPENIPNNLTCYYKNKKSCPYAKPHPLTGARSCSAFGDTKLSDVFKCPACAEASGMVLQW